MLSQATKPVIEGCLIVAVCIMFLSIRLVLALHLDSRFRTHFLIRAYKQRTYFTAQALLTLRPKWQRNNLEYKMRILHFVVSSQYSILTLLGLIRTRDNLNNMNFRLIENLTILTDKWRRNFR